MTLEELEEQYQEDTQQAKIEGEQYYRDMKEAQEFGVKEISLEVTENEIKAVTSVLIDVLDYYSTLPDRQEQMKLLVKATEVSKKLTKSYYR